MNEMIFFKQLTFAYEGQEVLYGVTASIASGGIHALFGPNGSGKTTLLKCLAGILRPQSGKIFLEKRDIRQMTAKERGREICYVPQEHQVSFPYSVEEIVLMGRTPHLGGISGPAKRDVGRARQAIQLVGIEEIATKAYTELSGGQRQLVLIARALAQDSPLMILDEPTSALDFKNQLKVWEVLQSLKGSGRTILVCTHDPNHVLWFCDEVVVLHQGQIIAQGPSAQLMTDQLLTQLYGPVCFVRDNAVHPRIQ